MELDDLRASWQAQHITPDYPGSATDGHMPRRADASATTVAGRLERSLIREAILVAFVIVLLGSYVADRVGHIGVAVAGALIDVYAIVLFAAVIRQIVLMRTLDPAGTVLAMQTRFAQIRLLRVRTTFAALAFGPLMWAPLAVVGADLLTGADATVRAVPYLVVNVAFGLMVLVGAVLASRRFGARMKRSALFAALADSLAGTAMRRAAASFSATREFGREESAMAAPGDL